jgi:hypothetical protein
MPDEIVLTGRIERGKLKVRGWRPLDLPDGEVTITVERKRATRSRIQNAWYWGQILRLLSDHTGYTVDELHDYCKQRFNPTRVLIHDQDGAIVDESRIGRSTTKLNRVTFGEYCEAIRQWAAQDLQVVIPDPDPNWRQQSEAA